MGKPAEPQMTWAEFKNKWARYAGKKSSAYQEHLTDLCRLLAAEMTRLARTFLEKETDPEKRWQRLCAVHQELSQLRRGDHRAVRTAIRREQWNHELEREEAEEDERAQQAFKDKMTGLCFAPMLNRSIAECFGGGEYGETMAEMLCRIKFDLPMDDLPGKTAPGKSDPAQPKPAESSLIQANPSNKLKPNAISGSPRREASRRSKRGHPVA